MRLSDLGTHLQLPFLHPTVVLGHISQLISSGYRYNSALTVARNATMLATRRESTSLLESPTFQDLKKGLSRLAALETTKQAPPISFADLEGLVTRLLHQREVELAAFMALTWLLAGRVGEVLRIPTAHFFPNDRPIRVKFTVSKAVWGPQEKSLPEGPLCSVVCDWHRLISQSQPPPLLMFNLDLKTVIACLRKEVHPDLSGHSIRRGALTHGDQRGGNSEDLMALSSHKSQWMLQRYIGRASSSRRDAMLRAGAAIASPST